MKELPNRFKPLVGIGILLVAAILATVYYSAVKRHDQPFNLFPALILGCFLLLGIVMVTERILPKWLLMTLLFLLGTAFFSVMALTVFGDALPWFVMAPIGAAGALAYYYVFARRE
ncbi:hypothetical protein [Luteimonas aquatica]|uniref:hypothetical protein n=1 Tax=Luteimonas aquatica TaxID=450364 RepID=UPI001F5906C2|nr:hypothetical protein [Luteimonas aquatica]